MTIRDPSERLIDVDRLRRLLVAGWDITDSITGESVDLNDHGTVAVLLLPLIEAEIERIKDEIERRAGEASR